MCPIQHNVSNVNTMRLSMYSYVPYSTQREQREHYVSLYVYLCASRQNLYGISYVVKKMITPTTINTLCVLINKT